MHLFYLVRTLTSVRIYLLERLLEVSYRLQLVVIILDLLFIEVLNIYRHSLGLNFRLCRGILRLSLRLFPIKAQSSLNSGTIWIVVDLWVQRRT